MANELEYQASIFRNRITKRFKHLRKWAKRREISCFRLYERDIPEVPLVVDYYDGWLHIAEFESPHKELPGPPELYQDTMTKAAAAAVSVHPDRTFYKTRRITGRDEQYERVDSATVTFPVPEGGLLFEVNLSDYTDTGLFLDHRITRDMVRSRAMEISESGACQMLNLFSYTASFSVYAAAGGARRTVSVDMSNTYTNWAKRNFSLNGIETAGHEFITEDVFAYLDRESGRKGRFDIIVLDPPTFSNSKKMTRTLDVQRDHGDLLAYCDRLLAPDGLLFFSTNKRKFRLTDVPNEIRATDITAETIPPDFRNKRIHSCFLMERAR